ncbi:MAG: hypothetical protein ACRD99_03480 [Nitrososphaera sp.]
MDNRKYSISNLLWFIHKAQEASIQDRSRVAGQPTGPRRVSATCRIGSSQLFVS